MSNKRIEKILKELADKGCENISINGQSVYLPNPNFNALFILNHCSGHFASTEMNLRQLLDWLLFVKKYHEKIDWDWLYKILVREHLDRFTNSLSTIGVKYLGFPKDIFRSLEKDDVLVDRILNDICSPEFSEKEDGSLLSGLWVKSRRWWHNRWKHKLCFADNLWIDFMSNVYSKILKPSHFKF